MVDKIGTHIAHIGAAVFCGFMVVMEISLLYKAVFRAFARTKTLVCMGAISFFARLTAVVGADRNKHSRSDRRVLAVGN